jgi:DNA-binding MurR/RpiR family transcriptional regulator
MRGGDMEVHHIFNFSQYPELRFDISNGITLQKDEHRKFHRIYGNRDNDLNQLLEFIKDETQKSNN